MTDPVPTTIRRRSLFGAAAAAAGLGVVVSGQPATAAVGVRPGVLPASLTRAFRSPGLDTAAGFRWWWPHGAVTPAEVAREVDQVADAGFGVLEVSDVTHSLRARDIDIDLATRGWGTPAWVAGIKAALRRAAKRGVRIDLTVGPSWPAAVPTVTPDDTAACTELAHGVVTVPAGTSYDGPVPEPVAPAAETATRRTLVAVQAFRVVDASDEPVVLAADSHVDLTAAVVDGALSWTAPAEGGEWLLLSYWRRGSAQEPEAGPHTEPRSYVVDHFGAAGAQAVISFWRREILDAELRGLLRDAGGYLFEDSLEIESDATIWTPRMLQEFAARAGYDLLPWLPVVVELDEDYQFDFETDTTQVRDDFNQVLSDLYRDHHLTPLQDFAHALGLGLRVQPYGLETDAVDHAALLDIAEGESLGFKNLDDFRVLAGGRDIAGHTVLSAESAAYNGAAYNTTWDRALQTINSIYAGGVNLAMIHGFAYAKAPEVTWPGFAAFSPYYDGAIGYGEAWGPRTPTWRHVRDVADYLSRTQLVLQSGVPRYDVVFLRQKGWTATGIGAQWATNSGIPVGWTHSFITSDLLVGRRARVEDGRLAPDGPAYKALLVVPDKFRGNALTMDVVTARRVRDKARRGLPVVLLGDWTQALPEGRAKPGETEELRAVLADVLALPTIRTVAVEADIPAALADLGVTPDVEHASSTVMTVRRVIGDVDLYYVANAKHAESRRLTRVTQDVWLTATRRDAVPFVLDAWRGTIVPAGLHERDGDRVRVRVDLQPGQTVVVALARVKQGPAPAYAVSTTAADVRRGGGRLLVRATAAGSYETTLSTGATPTTTVERVREPIALTGWHLALEDWQPGATVTATTKPVRVVDLSALRPWSQITGLEDVSGVGHYRTVVDLGDDWTDHDGALLELGEVNDTFRVTVNGTAVGPCDVLDTIVDLRGALRPGRNVIEVEVASTLLNRLRTVTPEVYGVAARQAYGLIGPVRLVPYVEQPLV